MRVKLIFIVNKKLQIKDNNMITDSYSKFYYLQNDIKFIYSI